MHVHLAEKTNWPPALGVLNPLIGTFQVTGQNDSWNIFYSLSALTKGRHFLANRFLNTPTKKVRKVKDDLKTFLNKPFLHSEAVEFMSQESNSDDLMGLEAESGEEIPFRFIKSEIYGTRSTTILTISSSGLYKVTEQTYLKGGEEGRRKEFEFSP